MTAHLLYAVNCVKCNICPVCLHLIHLSTYLLGDPEMKLLNIAVLVFLKIHIFYFHWKCAFNLNAKKINIIT